MPDHEVYATKAKKPAKRRKGEKKPRRRPDPPQSTGRTGDVICRYEWDAIDEKAAREGAAMLKLRAYHVDTWRRPSAHKPMLEHWELAALGGWPLTDGVAIGPSDDQIALSRERPVKGWGDVESLPSGGEG